MANDTFVLPGSLSSDELLAALRNEEDLFFELTACRINPDTGENRFEFASTIYDDPPPALGEVPLVVDGHGIPLAATITAGQAHESERLAATLEAVRLPNGKGRPTCRPRKLAGDKSYSYPAVRAYLRRRGILPIIPTRKDQRVNPHFDRAIYRQRNVIERGVGWLKENRQLATRHAKLAVNDLATVKLAVIRRCLCLLHDPSDRT